MQRELFPREVTGHVPRIELTGHERLRVEQHRGLVAYTPEEIVMRTSAGMLRITGEGLRFSAYTAGEALIVGDVAGVELSRKGGRP